MIHIEKDFNAPPDTSGLSTPLASRVIYEQLAHLYHGKCAWCETRLLGTRVVVQYRPTDAYPWLELEWSNILLSCDACNNARSSNFPIEGRRVSIQPQDLRADGAAFIAEEPLLLHPEIDWPEEHLSIDLSSGVLKGKTKRGHETIELVHLNRKELVAQRLETLRQVRFDAQSGAVHESMLKPTAPNLFTTRSLLSAEFPHLALDQTASKTKPLARNGDTKPSLVKESILDTAFATLNQCQIYNYFTLKHLTLKGLAKKKEIYILGENGDGKTLILQAILLALKGSFIQHRSEKKLTGAILDLIEKNPALKLEAKDNQGKSYGFDRQPNVEAVFAYGVNRSRGSADNVEPYGFLTLFDQNHYLLDPVKWLKYLYAKSLEAAQRPKKEQSALSLDTAKEMVIALLDRNVVCEVSLDEVHFIERGSRLSLNELSEGYRMVMTWIFDLVSRLAKLQPNAKSTVDFKALVLVDEIELHLHPKWEQRLVRSLRSWFPNIQFIFTTHSPMIVLGASEDAVFYRAYKDDKGHTHLSDPFENKDLSQLMANGITTSPLFGLESARSTAFNPETQELETRDSYLHHRIHKQVRQRIDQKIAAGELYISPDTIDAMVAEALAENE